MAERPFWARRGFDIALEGSRLRMAELSGSLSALPEAPTSSTPAWLAATAVLFVGYAALFVTQSLTAFEHGFDAATRPVSLAVGSLVVVLGIFVLFFGVTVTRRTRRLRAGWPLLTLGPSLVAMVGSDWWISSGYGPAWGWISIRDAFVSLDPLAWSQVNSANFGGGGTSTYRLYVALNLCLLAIVTVSSTILIRRLGLSYLGARRSTPLEALGCVGMLAVVASAWLWVVDETNLSMRGQARCIALILTVMAFPGVAAFCRIGRQRVVTD